MTGLDALGAGARSTAVDREGLRERAREILTANWTGGATVPSRTLYPHQWGWDAACNAIGWTHVQPANAFRELESILAGQWADGRVPHIVFDPSVCEEAYFPGPEFWRSEQVAGSPGTVATSGITQPPLHARAALEAARAAPDADDGRAFLARVYPRLVAQHRYLAGRRDAGDGGLAAIVHPWESGLDNAPTWDAPLAAVELPPEGVPPYQRRDLMHVGEGQRPTGADYDRFVVLARAYRDGGYVDDALARTSAFLVEDPLFNAVWLWSTEALAEIAVLLDESPEPHLEAAERIRGAMRERLWDPREGRFRAHDLVGERLLAPRSIGALVPLLDPGLGGEQASAIVAELFSEHFLSREQASYSVPTYDLAAPDFESRRYWRGPVWVITNWMLVRGLRQHAHEELAEAVAADTLALVARSGFREYFDPFTGEGYGSEDFSWTASLVLDLLGETAPT